jgi:hypothetical protein
MKYGISSMKSVNTNSIKTGSGNHAACSPESGAGPIPGMKSTSKAAAKSNASQPVHRAAPTTNWPGHQGSARNGENRPMAKHVDQLGNLRR